MTILHVQMNLSIHGSSKKKTGKHADVFFLRARRTSDPVSRAAKTCRKVVVLYTKRLSAQKFIDDVSEVIRNGTDAWQGW
jgi:hypothetical protein